MSIIETVQMRDRIQKQRIALGNKLHAFTSGRDVPANGEFEMVQRQFDRFVETEKDVDKYMENLAKKHRMFDYITGVKGIGPSMAAQILYAIDISKADTISALWRYCGYAVFNDKREYPTPGEKLHYNKKLKTVFYKAKEYYQDNRKDWTKNHIHLASQRKMIKIFIAHLWIVWRELDGLPTRVPYVQEYMGHTDIVPPDDFGWYKNQKK